MSYRQDMLQCRTFAQRTPEHMIHTATMALLSARIQFIRVGDMMHDVYVNGLESESLFGYKKAGYKYMRENMDALYVQTMTLQDDVDLLDLWSNVPGLGLVKAGFAVQLIRGTIGCIDSHNMKLYGVTDAELRMPKTLSARAKLLKIDRYIKLCGQLGGSERLWEQWCILMAAKYPQHWATGEDVSNTHVAYLNHSEVYL